MIAWRDEGETLDEFVEQFEEKCEELSNIKLETAPSLEERKRDVEYITEVYFSKVGKMPKGAQLNQLTNYILITDLKNVDRDKVTNTDYPILSATQIKRRSRKQSAMLTDTMDFLHSKFNRRMDSLYRRVTESWTEE